MESINFLGFLLFISLPHSLYAYDLLLNESIPSSDPSLFKKHSFSFSLWPLSSDSPVWHNVILISLVVSLYEAQFSFLWLRLNKLKSTRTLLFCIRKIIKTAVGAALTSLLFPIFTPFYVILSRIKYLLMRIAKFRFGKSFTEPFGNDIVWVTDPEIPQPMINVLLKCEGNLDIEYAKNFIETKVLTARLKDGALQFRKFKQTLQYCLGYYVWKEVKDFDINNHVKAVNLEDIFGEEKVDSSNQRSSNCAEKRVCMYLEKYGSVNIPTSIPQWEIICIKDGDKKEFTLLFRIHHSMGDGVALMRYLLEVLADNPTQISLLGPPQHPIVKLLTYVWSIALIPFSFVHVIFKGKENPIHGKPLSGKKIFVTSKDISLDSVKAIKNKTRSTITDVMFSCLSASLGSLFEKRHCDVPEITIMFPIGFEDLSAPVTLTNTFGMGLAELPTPSKQKLIKHSMGTKAEHTDSSIRRLKCVKKRLDTVKEDASVISLYWVMSWFSTILPQFLVSRFFNSKGMTMGVSNVPGPKHDVFLWKCKILEMRFWVPDREPTGAGFTMMSYKDQFRVSFSIDSNLVESRDEAEEVIEEFFAALNELKHQTEVN